MHTIFERVVPYHFRDILGLTSVNAGAVNSLPPAFNYAFTPVDLNANGALDDKDKTKLSEKAIKQVSEIQRALCASISDAHEVGFSKLAKFLSNKTNPSLAFVARSL